MHLILFDIDGTLVDSSGYETPLYSDAVSEVLDIPFERDWGRYKHVTDGGILDEIMEGSGLALDRQDVQARVQSGFVRRTKRYVADNPDAVKEIPGAKALVHKLCADPSCAVAIATGGWEETARLKLSGIGIDVTRIPLASSSDATSRVEIMKIAEQRALNGARSNKKTYFGDAIWDKSASESLGYDFVAVGSTVSHPVRFEDLRDHEKIFKQLGL